MPIEHQVDDVVGEGYRIRGVLGRGGTAITYEAEASDGMRVAIKQLLLWHEHGEASWKRLELFEREARTLASLSHPSIPRYIGSFQVEDEQGTRFYLVRELIEGKSLAHMIEDGWSGSEEEVIAFARDLLGVLRHLHGLSPPLVHRDVKPSNVIRREDGRLFLVDFGAVRDAARGPDGSTVVGTYGYMSPEQFRGSALPASDLYGLGATVLFLLTHRRPVDLPQRGLGIDIDAIDTLSPRMRTWLGSLLEPDPEKRMTSAEAALLALDQPHVDRARRSQPAGRRQTVLLLALLATVLLAGGTAVWLESHSPADPSRVAGRAPVYVSNPREYVEPVKTLRGQWKLVFDVVFTSDSRLLVAAAGDHTIKVWDVADKKVIRSFVGHKDRVYRVALDPRDRVLLSGGQDGARLWSFDDAKPLGTLSHPGACFGVAIAPDGKRAATGGQDGRVFEWSLPDGQRLRVLKHGGRRMLGVAYSADGELLAASGDHGSVSVWGREGEKPKTVLAGHKGPVNQVLFSSDGRTLVSAGDDRTARAWQLDRAALMRTLDRHKDEVWAIALSPDQKTLLTAGKDDVIRTWELYRGKLDKHQSALQHGVTDLEFSPDGKVFAAAGMDGSIRIWNAPGAYWRPPLPPEDYQEPPRSKPASPAAALAAEAEEELDNRGTRKGRADRAEKLLKQALDLDPSCAPAQTQLARLAYVGGHVRGSKYRPESLVQAHELVDKALEMDPRYGPAWRVKGWAYRFQRNFGEARKMADKALELAPEDPSNRLLLAELYCQAREWDACLAQARKVIETARRRTQLAAAWGQLADVYKHKKAYDAVEDTYIAQMRLEPESAWARGNYANFLVKRQQWDRAIEMADAALNLMDYPAARMTKARAYAFKAYNSLQRGQLDQAKEQLDAAFAAWENEELPHLVMGLYLRELAVRERDLGKLGKAKRHFERALAIEPDYPQAKAALAEHVSYEARLKSR